MLLPIYIDGNQEGTLTVERQGALTVMRADMRDVGRVVRLSVYGEKSGYLGVPEPQDGRLRLTRGVQPSVPEPPKEGPGEKRHVLWMGGKPYYF